MRRSGEVLLAWLLLVMVPMWAGELELAAPACVGRGEVYSIPVRMGTGAEKRWQASDFSVRVHGVDEEVCGYSHFRYPVSVGMLVDASGSMEPRFGGGREAMAETARAFLRTRGPQDEFFLGYVNEEPAVQIPFTSDLRRLLPAAEVRTKGRTALIDSIYLALNTMRKARCATRGLLVLSDGEDNRSVYRMDELRGLAREARVPIFLIAPGDFPETRGPREMGMWAELSGGGAGERWCGEGGPESGGTAGGGGGIRGGDADGTHALLRGARWEAGRAAREGEGRGAAARAVLSE